jgi:calcineurin-like phosphoesterase family protein
VGCGVVKVEELTMNRYIADTHFCHENIIRHDNRPFLCADEMDKVLIKNWNSVVKNEDTTYILGDFCWKKEDSWIHVLQQLNGNKVLIKGNHDLKSMSQKLKQMFSDIKDYKEITDGQKHVIMCHYPILLYKGSYNENCYMLCGHVHTTRENDFLEKWVKDIKQGIQYQFDNRGNIYNVGCMMPWMNYTPRTLEEIINYKR